VLNMVYKVSLIDLFDLNSGIAILPWLRKHSHIYIAQDNITYATMNVHYTKTNIIKYNHNTFSIQLLTYTVYTISFAMKLVDEKSCTINMSLGILQYPVGSHTACNGVDGCVV